MTFSVAVAGASGYAGGELLRLLLPHPDVEIGALTAASNAGSRLGELQPHLLPLADRVLEPTDAETAGRARRRLPRAAARRSRPRSRPQLPGDDRRHRLRRRLPARPTRPPGSVYGGAHAGTWPYGLPELPGQRAQLARRQADRRARLLPDRRHARRSPRRSPPAWSSRTSSSSRRPARPAPASRQAAPARQRGDGLGQRLRRRRRAPAHAGDRPEPRRRGRGAGVGVASPRCWCRCRAASSPPARRGSPRRTDAAAVRAAYEKAYADEPFVHLLPEGQWPTTASVLGANTVHCPGRGRRGRRPARRRRRDRQPHQGHRRRRRAVHEPRPRPDRDHRPPPWSSAVTRRSHGAQ